MIEDFIDRYTCIFNYDKKVVENYITELKELVKNTAINKSKLGSN